MVDPDIAYQDFPGTLQRGIDDNVFLLRQNGSVWKGVVWPGVVAFPDWFAENTTKFWVRQKLNQSLASTNTSGYFIETFPFSSSRKNYTRAYY